MLSECCVHPRPATPMIRTCRTKIPYNGEVNPEHGVNTEFRIVGRSYVLFFFCQNEKSPLVVIHFNEVCISLNFSYCPIYEYKNHL